MSEEFTYISPMKAKLSDISFLQQIDNDERWAAGEKFDGYREVLYLGKERNEMFSSLGTSHIDKVPQFKIVIPELAGTVVDCEGMSPTRRLEDNASCFKSDPPNAIAWQREHGQAFLVGLDVLRYKGIDTASEQFGSRRVNIEWVTSKLREVGMPIRTEQLVFRNKLAYYKMIVARIKTEGHEGIILKDMFAPYRPGKRANAWLKVKREEVLICTITGWIEGVGKFEGLVGSLAFTCGSLSGYTSGMDDATRIDMTQNFEAKYLGKQCYIRCQEVTDLGSLRHPRYEGLVS